MNLEKIKQLVTKKHFDFSTLEEHKIKETRFGIQVKRINEDFDRLISELNEQRQHVLSSTLEHHVKSGVLLQDLQELNKNL